MQNKHVTGKEEIGLSVIIPMFNEEEGIAGTIDAMVEELETTGVNWELILVNDGSTDGTRKVCRQARGDDERIRIIGYEHNRGRGYALRRGFDAARGNCVITIDADLTYSPDHISRILKELKESPADLILGSAYMKGGKVVNVPFKRLLISRVGNLVLGLFFPGKIKTITCVLRGYRKGVLDSLELESDGKEIHLEILSKAIAVGFKVKEIPAVLTGRSYGKSKFRFKATSISHLLFSFYQKPILIFGFLGVLMMIAGLWIGVIVIISRYTGTLDPTRPLIYLMLLLIVTGLQMLCFGLIAAQMGIIKKEIYKIQKQSNLLKRKFDDIEPAK